MRQKAAAICLSRNLLRRKYFHPDVTIRKRAAGNGSKDFPEEILPPYQVSAEELDAFYGAGNWRRMKDETTKDCAMSRNPGRWKSIPWKSM